MYTGNPVIPRYFAMGLLLGPVLSVIEGSPLWKGGLGGFSNYRVSRKCPVACGEDLYLKMDGFAELCFRM